MSVPVVCGVHYCHGRYDYTFDFSWMLYINSHMVNMQLSIKSSLCIHYNTYTSKNLRVTFYKIRDLHFDISRSDYISFSHIHMHSLYSFCITANDSYIMTGCEWDRFELLKKHITNTIWENRSLQLFTYTVQPPILYFWAISLQMTLNWGHTVHVGIWLGSYYKVHNITEKVK